jgi:CHAT domain-containing protein/Tfp pilus assembly protein PilF
MRRAALAVAGWAIVAGARAAAADEVQVVAVAPGRAAAAAGLRAGDRLREWSQADESRGTISSPFDLRELEAERGPRGPVRLRGLRSGEAIEVELFPDEWGLDVRPPLPADLAAIHDEARQLAAAGQADPAVSRLRELGGRLGEGAPAEARAWALLEIAQVELSRGRTDAVASTLREAIALPEGNDLVRAQIQGLLGDALLEAERFEQASDAFRQALALRPASDPPSLARAALAERQTTVAYRRGKGMEETRPALKEALALVDRLAPRSLALVRTIHALGPVLDSEGESRALFERALGLAAELAPDSLLHAKTLQLMATVTSDPTRKLELARQALAMRERRAPESLEVVASLRQLAVLLNQQGQPGPAEEHLLRALALQERLAPGTQQHGRLLNAVALQAMDAGDLARSESFFRRYLELTERIQPDSIWLAIGFSNFAQLLHDRREFEEAEAYLARGWRIVEREAPRSDVAGFLLANRGTVARSRGAAEAQQYLAAALDVFRATDPRNIRIPAILEEVGDLAREQGRLDEAQGLYEQALAAAVERAPASIPAGNAHASLGVLALARGHLQDAEKHHRTALDLRRELAPDSIAEAESSHALAMVLLKSGRRTDSLELLRRAVAALEAQGRRLGGSAEVRADFRAHYFEYYRDLEALLLELGRAKEAFEIVERSRARGLLALLAARDLRFARDVPADLESARRAADAEYDRVLRRLGTPRAPLADTARASLRDELARARQRQDEVRAQVQAIAPRLAAVRDPEALDLDGVKAVLEPGTLLLAYSLGPAAARVYAVGPGPDDFAVHDLRATAAEIRQAVEGFREQIERARGTLGRRALEDQADRLGTLLLGPVAEPLGRADRLLVVPDGVLHLVPLSALRRGGAYLIETLPVQVVPSVTVSRALAQSGARADASGAVVGFGDPTYPAGALADAERTRSATLRSGVLDGLRLEPLPAGRRELQALASLAPGTARLWLGTDATEERAKAVDRAARIVHFATHGFVDDAFPLESGLALSIPARWQEGADNGLLQAWEVFDQVRLDADLVTLSACQTGLGRQVVGEGLLGLIWAFQYAGARSVLASLWAVNDDATGELMRRFYGHLRAGRTRSESLRRAQVDLLRRPSTSAPFFWASFQLSGDWN